MPRFSANLGFLWPGLPLLEQIDAAARAGFKAVELHFPYDVAPEAVRAACARHGMTLVCINTDIGPGPDGHRGLAAIAGREAEFAALADQALAWAEAAGATAVHVMAGLVPEAEVEAAGAVLAKNLAATAEKAEARGVKLFIEPLNKVDNPGYFYSKVERAVAIIDHVGAANVRLMFDAYHVGMAQGDVVARLTSYIDHVGHIQIAGMPGRSEPDTGTLDYRAFFDAVDALGYRGWIGCEYRPRAATEDGLRWMEALGVSL